MSGTASIRFIFLVHYFPPINSSGAKRAEAVSKYLVAAGHKVTVITTQKSSANGAFTEKPPPGVDVIELDWLGRNRASVERGDYFEPMYTGRPSLKRRFKDFVMNFWGQLPDPRLPFALSFACPWLASRARSALAEADVVVGSSPPWPMLLAAIISKRRFRIPCILDYRDHFSECHEMPGGRFAKWLEKKIDRLLVRNAEHVVAISVPMAGYYRTMSKRVSTILNGYDHEILDAARQKAQPGDGHFLTLRYMGIVSPGRVPHNILRALVQFKAMNLSNFEKLRIEYYGSAALVDEVIQHSYPSISSAFHFYAAVPYSMSLQLVVEADYLLFAETSSKATLSASGILTTKLFEYIGSGRPVLGDISVDTLAGSLLVESGAHHIVGDNVELFLDAFSQPDFFTRRPDEISGNVWKLSRQAQALQYADLATKVVRKI